MSYFKLRIKVIIAARMSQVEIPVALKIKQLFLKINICSLSKTINFFAHLQLCHILKAFLPGINKEINKFKLLSLKS